MSSTNRENEFFPGAVCVCTQHILQPAIISGMCYFSTLVGIPGNTTNSMYKFGKIRCIFFFFFFLPQIYQNIIMLKIEQFRKITIFSF